MLYVGKAQEKTPVFRTEKRRNPETRQTYPWIVRSTAMVNHYYFYCVDRDFGPFFIKFCSYFPYNAKLCLNGHEYLKRQLARQGIAFEALDNGVDLLLPRLHDAEPEVRQMTCFALGLLGDKRAIEPLQRVALGVELRRASGVRFEDLPLERSDVLPLLERWVRERPTLVVVSPVPDERRRPSAQAWAPLRAELAIETRKPNGELCDQVFRLSLGEPKS